MFVLQFSKLLQYLLVTLVNMLVFLLFIVDKDVANRGFKRYSRIRHWKDIGPGDIKIFLGHLIAMELVCKNNMEKYWSHNKTIHTPFFGKYMSRSTFQSILSNLHLVDNNSPDKNKDTLYKIRPFVDMCLRNFCRIYKIEKELSLYEGMCPFKGKFKFRQFNSMKPNQFHINLFKVYEASSGYVLAFDIYSGKKGCDIVDNCEVLDNSCTVTIKVVIVLLDTSKLLDTGHFIYMDNYHTSPELFEELHFRETYACCTVRANCKGLPEALKISKLKKRDGHFQSNGPVLAIRWCCKRAVFMLSTIHDAKMIERNNPDFEGRQVVKPKCVVDYCHFMEGWVLQIKL